MANQAQRSFARGELAPALHARADLEAYRTGLRTCRNMIVRKEGGLANRPGTRFVGEVKDSSTAVRLIEFIFDDTDTFLLEFGERYIRFYQGGGRVDTSGVAAWLTATAYAVADLVTASGVTYYCTAAHTSGATTQPGTGANWQTNWYALAGAIYEIPTPYLATELADLQWVQDLDVVTIVHPAHAPAQLKRFATTRWTLADMVFGPTVSAPTSLSATGGGGTAVTYWGVTAIDPVTGEESLAATYSVASKVPSSGAPTTVAWVPVSGVVRYRVYRATDGNTFGYLAEIGGLPTAATNVTFANNPSSITTNVRGATVADASPLTQTVFTLAASKPTDGKVYVTGSLEVTTADTGGTLRGKLHAYYSRDGEPLQDAGVIFTAFLLGAGTNTELVDGVGITIPDNGYTQLAISLAAEVLASASYAGLATYTAQFTATSIDWTTAGLSYVDTGVAPEFAIAPPYDPKRFRSAGDYPSVVGQFQQRLVLAATDGDPRTGWMSKVGIPENFCLSTPLADDDPVTFRLKGTKSHRIRHAVDVARLVVLSHSGEWVLEGDVAGILMPSAINGRQHSSNGASTVRPLASDTALIYVQARGKIVRDLADDGNAGVEGVDLTATASHLVRQYTIVDGALVQNPDPVLWLVRSDGMLLGLTYDRQQQLTAWHRHDTDGAVENIAVVPEGDEDAVYLSVRRTINGVTKRYIERLAKRDVDDLREAVFLDASAGYDGRPVVDVNTGLPIAAVCTLTTGSDWNAGTNLTATFTLASNPAADAEIFVFGDIGKTLVATDADGRVVRLYITNVADPHTITVQADTLVPTSMRGIACRDFAKTAQTIAGLDYLEGKAVAVLADGAVLSSPNNPSYSTVYTVTGGQIVLDQAYGIVQVGLPYLSDVETLDLDTPSATLKERKQLVNRVSLALYETRGVFAVAGLLPPDDDPLGDTAASAGAAGMALVELKARDGEDYSQTTTPITDTVEINTTATWATNARVGIRQIDPLPMTLLMIAPTGYLQPAA